MVYVKFQSVYITTSKTGSQLLLASTCSSVLLGRGCEKAFNECLGVSNFFPSVNMTARIVRFSFLLEVQVGAHDITKSKLM